MMIILLAINSLSITVLEIIPLAIISLEITLLQKYLTSKVAHCVPHTHMNMFLISCFDNLC